MFLVLRCWKEISLHNTILQDVTYPGLLLFSLRNPHATLNSVCQYSCCRAMPSDRPMDMIVMLEQFQFQLQLIASIGTYRSLV